MQETTQLRQRINQEVTKTWTGVTQGRGGLEAVCESAREGGREG